MSHWRNSTTPTGDYIELRENIKLDFNEPLFDLVFLPGNLKLAWQQVRANKGAPGIDGITIEQFPDWATQHWEQSKAQLLKGEYRPQAVKRVEIANLIIMARWRKTFTGYSHGVRSNNTTSHHTNTQSHI